MNHNLRRLILSVFTGVIWAVLCIALFVGFDGELSWVPAVLFGLYVYTSIMLWKAVLDREPAPLALMFWLFHTNFLLLPGFSQAFHGTFFWSSYDAYSQEDLLFACLIIITGFLAFSIGTGYAKRKIRRLNVGISDTHFLVQPLKATWLVQLFLMIILAGLAGVILSMGTDFFMSRSSGRMPQSLVEVGLRTTLPRSLGAGVLLFSTYILAQRWRQRKRIQVPMLVIFLAALGLNSIINFPLSLARFWLFGFIITLIWSVAPLLSVKLRSVFVIGLTILQLTLFPWFSQITRNSGLMGFDIESIREYMQHGDFDGFQSIANTLIYARETGLEFGRNLISVVLFFIPRSMWNKAEPLGSAAAEHMGYAYTNISAPIYGELYIDFGIFSLVTGMAIIGFGVRLFDAYYTHMIKIKQYGTGLLLTAAMSGYLIILLRGSLLAVNTSIATLFGLLIFASWLGTHSIPGRLREYRPHHHL